MAGGAWRVSVRSTRRWRPPPQQSLPPASVHLPYAARHPDRWKPQIKVNPALSCGINDSNAGTKIQERLESVTPLGWFVLLYRGKPFFNLPRTCSVGELFSRKSCFFTISTPSPRRGMMIKEERSWEFSYNPFSVLLLPQALGHSKQQ